MKKYIRKSGLAVACGLLAAFVFSSCGTRKQNIDFTELEASLQAIVSTTEAQVGIALIVDSADTLTINNSGDYPLMSMFKLHEAIAVCRTLEQGGATLDSLLAVKAEELSLDTWSPMLKEFGSEGFTVSIRRLMEYLLIHSDNNASNILFDRIVSVGETDAIIGEIMPQRGFRLIYKESEMAEDHSRAYLNASSPLSYAALVDKVFTTDVASPSDTEFIREMMRRCDTGMDRIAAGLPENADIKFAHRTGSGYTNDRGVLAALNDGGHIVLPDGRSYTLVVMVKDYPGPQPSADRLIARISSAVYRFISGID